MKHWQSAARANGARLPNSLPYHDHAGPQRRGYSEKGAKATDESSLKPTR
jgi:hypothetical protein